MLEVPTAVRAPLAALGVLLALLSPELGGLLAETTTVLTAAVVALAAVLVRHGGGLASHARPAGRPATAADAAPAYLAERVADPHRSPRRPRAPGRA